MQIGMIGLGRMGMNMARRLIGGGHEVVVYNRTQEKVVQMEKEGAVGSKSLEDFVGKLETPRVVWMMLPTGGPIDDYTEKLSRLLSRDDILIDGGNSYFKDDLRRDEMLRPNGIHYVDAGVSGGIWGLKVGYCTMIGGAKADFRRIEPALRTLAPEDGYLYCGPLGSGHYVKMVHNGIEYAMMEAYGEGFEMIKASPYAKSLRLGEVAHLWNRGSVIRSWLLELLESAFEKDPNLDNISGHVEDTGEGRWAVVEAIERGVSAVAIAYSVFKRFESRQKELFSNKVLAVLRREFGGHVTAKAAESLRSSGTDADGVKTLRTDKDGSG